MHITKPHLILAALAISVFLTGCENDEQYQSHPPIFSDITFNSDTIYAGDTIVATAIQSQGATLVDRTTYEWTLTQNGNPVDTKHEYVKEVVYPNSPSNPTDKFTVEQPGTYNLTLEACYNISGQSDGATYSNFSQDGSFSYSCTASLFRYVITLNKRITVVKK